MTWFAKSPFDEPGHEGHRQAPVQSRESGALTESSQNRTNLAYAKVLNMEELEPRNPDGTYVMTEKRLKMIKKIESALIDYKRIRERLEAEKHEDK